MVSACDQQQLMSEHKGAKAFVPGGTCSVRTQVQEISRKTKACCWSVDSFPATFASLPLTHLPISSHRQYLLWQCQHDTHWNQSINTCPVVQEAKEQGYLPSHESLGCPVDLRRRSQMCRSKSGTSTKQVEPPGLPTGTGMDCSGP